MENNNYRKNHQKQTPSQRAAELWDTWVGTPDNPTPDNGPIRPLKNIPEL